MLPGLRFLAVSFLVALAPSISLAADWPMWRHDAARSGASAQELPAQLHLNWVRRLPPLEPAWPDQPAMQLDANYEPIVAGKLLFVGSSFHDGVAALDTATGREVWHFATDGPVRYAPVAWEGRLLFGCDDGYLYCLDAAKGSLLWKFRGGPNERKVLGNERLISTWPVRGAPVVADGTVYFAAGIWPFMGIFVHAVDARTGKLVWTNDGDSCVFIKQPHNADSFAGVAPQGPLVVHENKLLVPGGRSVPACFDRKTGKLLYYQLGENGKRGGGSEVQAFKGHFFNGGAVFQVDTGKHVGIAHRRMAFNDRIVFGLDEKQLTALDLAGAKVRKVQAVDRKGKKTTVERWAMEELGKVAVSPASVLIQAGKRVYLGGKGEIVAYDLPLPADGKGLPSWRQTLEGTVASLIAGDDRLFAVTREGGLFCFGEQKAEPEVPAVPVALPAADLTRSRELIQATGVKAGHALIWGDPGFALLRGLAEQSQLSLIVLETDAKKAQALRDQLRASPFSGEKLSVVRIDAETPLPPYLASLALVESFPLNPDTIRRVFHSLRPYGGVAVWRIPAREQGNFRRLVAELELPGAEVKCEEDRALLSRAGALPDSANWTHEHGDAANTRVSRDRVVKAPLGVLWWGGASHDGILPRHGHGPQPQVVDGRLFIEGIDMLRAMDVYTGRVLWEAKLPGVGVFYNNLAHQPGANATGSNYVSLSDGIYIVHGRRCLRLDPATGKRLGEYALPPIPGVANTTHWGYLNVVGDHIIGGADPLFDAALAKQLAPKLDENLPDEDEKKDEKKEEKKDEKKEEKKDEKKPADDPISKAVAKAVKLMNDNLSSSRHLFVLDRKTGKHLWTVTSQYGFRHNAICAGGGRLYCIDRLSANQLAKLKRRGEDSPHQPRLLVLDLKTGKELWRSGSDVFGTWVSYSEERDILVEAGRVARDGLTDEPTGMRAYQGATGKVLWMDKKHQGPAMIHGDTILMNGNACDLRTGKLKMRKDPLTGDLVEWKWTRNYGCNTPMASEHLLTFRSGAAGFFDLCNDGGTGNLGGFRSSCTNNLVVANGVLSAPDYTRTCTCNYQNQTSLALIPMPEAEMWTFFGARQGTGMVRRLGINLGAPGDRRAENGTLWVEFPATAGKSPMVPISTIPAKPEYLRRHSSQINGEGIAWVAGSAAKGLHALTIELAPQGGLGVQRRYTVRLHFAELEPLGEGERIFDVSLQNKTVLKRFDIVKEAGGRNRGLVKEFKGIPVARELVIGFLPDTTVKAGASLLSGVEILLEE